MEYLRWILLLTGALVLLGIYLVGRRRDKSREPDLYGAVQRDASNGSAPGAASEPLGEEFDDFNELVSEKAAVRQVEGSPTPPSSKDAPESSEPSKARSEVQQGSELEEKIVALHVAARMGDTFQGKELLKVFRTRGYEFGDLDIFHLLRDGQPVFSVANMVKPGFFDFEAMETFTTPGVSLFMRLPGPLAPNIAFDVLINEANALAKDLNAEVQDAQHSTLMKQTIQHMRDDVQAYQARVERAFKSARR
jgi:cell division protein ZipA